MNRSVITWMIAAGVLAMGTGVAPGTALADPVDVGAVGEVENPRPVRGEGRPGAEASPRSEGRDAGRDGNRPCEWVRVCRPGPRPQERERGNTVLGAMRPTVGPGVQRPPVAAAEPAAPALPELVPVYGDSPQAATVGPPVGAPVGAVPPAAGPAVLPRSAPIPVAVAAQPPVGAPVGAVPPAAGPAVLPRPAPIPVAVAPIPAAPNGFRPSPVPPAAPRSSPPDSPAPPRLGYPDELRTANLGRVASLALPGLAAIAGMTALGGVFGYRQAKAGYLMRAAGAGRFLR